MAKEKLNITLDADLIEYVKMYASENRTTVSEVVGQFLLNLKRTREKDPTEIIFSDPAFRESMLECIAKIQNGKMKWLGYDEVFK
ncbi:MAG: DUF6364 family protein [Candidatus Eremiobacteraeota bacterium]|nr:DUF6364 family protein [Candidatus Eremiobacteraeota bacterium]